jgi:TetR/AcrR family transcriptional regulator, transcriptional repressor of bet genes
LSSYAMQTPKAPYPERRVEGGNARGAGTRARLVDAVIESVSRYGLEGTTVTRLCEISGYSRGLISFHFSGKDQLLEAALARAISVYEESWDRDITSSNLTAVARLHRVIDHDLDFAGREGEILALWWAAWGETRAKEIYSASSASRDVRFTADLAGMFRESGLTAARARHAASLVNAALLGYWLQLHLEGDTTALRDMKIAGHALVDALVPETTA